MTKEEKRLQRLLTLKDDRDMSLMEAVEDIEDKHEESIKMIDSKISDVESRLETYRQEKATDIDDKTAELQSRIDDALSKIKQPKDGKDYLLTEEDKKDIASKITVPVVEKIVEKTETIIEQPITVKEITNEIKEVAISDTGEEIVNKINSLPIKPEFQIDAKHIKNLPQVSAPIWRGGGMTREAVLELIGTGGSTYNFSDDETPTGDVNGVNKDFVIANTPTAGTLKVYVSGARMRITEDYTFSGTTISFTIAPPTGSIIICDYRY